jgi:hypothetical protein
VEILNILLGFLPPDTHFTLTADAYFGYIGWIEAHTHLNCTISLASNELSDFFVYNLKYHQYRVFSNGKIFFSVWYDNAIISILITAFKLSKKHTLDFHGINYATLPSILSQDTTNKMLDWSHKELKALAKKCGVAMSMCIVFLWFGFFV